MSMCNHSVLQNLGEENLRKIAFLCLYHNHNNCLLILVALEDFHSVKVKVIYWFWTTLYNKGQKINY